MKITAKLFATLRSHAPPGTCGTAFEDEVPAETTVTDMLRKWRIPEGVTLIVFVNSVHADRDRILEDGDILAVFPPIVGG